MLVENLGMLKTANHKI